MFADAAWPVTVAFIFCFFFVVFRTAISRLIDRARGAKYGDNAVDFSGGAASGAIEQQKGNNPLTAAMTRDTVPASHAMPPPNEAYAPIEQEIRTALTQVHLPPDVEKSWLIRGVAAFRIQRVHEINYRLLFGSQIELLLAANTPAPLTIDKAREIYEQARAAHPNEFHDFPFEAWSGYPVRAGLLTNDTQNEARVPMFRITAIGRDFLKYLVDNSLTSRRSF